MINKLFTVLALLFALVSCSKKEQAPTGFVNEIYSPEFAARFRILGRDSCSSVLIQSIDPWQGAQGETRSLLVLRNGEEVPEGFDGQVIRGNAQRVVAMSSTHIAMLHELGLTHRIVGVSGLRYVNNPEIQRRASEIADVGHEGDLNYELLLSVRPDIVLLYGVSGPNTMEQKLAELNIPYIYIGDYIEDEPLAKAEWMVALAELMGRREKGIELFSQLPLKYKRIKQLVAAEAYRPKVMFNIPFGDAWYMPTSNSYLSRLLRDAGGECVYTGTPGFRSEPVDLEEAFRLASLADVWLNVGAAKSLDDLAKACPKFVDTRCFHSGAVFNNTARSTPNGGNDFYESAVTHPHLILRDLVNILHPGLVSDSLVYYKQLR